jgi:putrescine importer
VKPDASSPPSATVAATTDPKAVQPHLRRVLGLGDLIFYGIVLIQPVGSIGIFGLANKMSAGHVTTTILVALVAMLLTAVSYGRMAGLYPAAGSAYTYVGRGLHPHLGFVAGWAMFLDYLVIPVVSVVYGALSLQRLVDDWFPGLSHRVVSFTGLPMRPERASFVFWVVVLVGLVTYLNVRGIKWTARTNQLLTAVMFLVIGVFVVQAIRYLLRQQGWGGVLSVEPFYNPRTFDWRALGTATSLAALTYIGFDGISTLAEDVKDPKRTVPLAIVLVCLLMGLCAGLIVYLAQRVWPDYSTFKNLETAFFDVCGLVGGKFLFNAFSLVMAVACLGSALTGQVGAARILFGMGRDRALPGCFARLDAKGNPVLNLGLIGVLALVGAWGLPYEDAATLINFGAFLAFMGVNLAVIREFCGRPPAGHKRHWLFDLVTPALGFCFCLAIWCSLPKPAKVVGGLWCALGLAYTAVRTRGFTRPPVRMDLGV